METENTTALGHFASVPDFLMLLNIPAMVKLEDRFHTALALLQAWLSSNVLTLDRANGPFGILALVIITGFI